MLFLGVHVFYVLYPGEVERINEEESVELKGGCPLWSGGELSMNDGKSGFWSSSVHLGFPLYPMFLLF